MNSTNEAVKKGRKELPSYLIVDSQSVKIICEGEERELHGGKTVAFPMIAAKGCPNVEKPIRNKK